MRIAYILSTESWGGLEMNQVRNALWMKQRGHETFVLGLADSKTEVFCKENSIPFLVIPKHRKYYDWRAAGNLNQLLSSNQIEHIILRDVRDMSVCVAAKKFSKGAFKVHYFMEMQLGVDKKNFLHTVRFKGLDTWSCPLKWLEEQVKERTKMDHSKIVRIPSALSTNQFKNAPDKFSAREQLKLPREKTLIGLAGRFDPQKGQLMLLKAFQELNNEQVELVFIGQATMNEGNEYVREIQEFIQNNQLENRVHLLSFRNDTEVFYSAIDTFVMASKCETVGMVTLESMATGTIVIGSNAGGTREILQEGKLGYLFIPENQDSLLESLRLFLDKKYFVTPSDLQKGVEAFDVEPVLNQVEARLEFCKL
jgi:glycosyltransferase involved in cell wall biosynthesis